MQDLAHRRISVYEAFLIRKTLMDLFRELILGHFKALQID